MAEWRKAPPGREQTNDADDEINDPIAVGTAPALSRHARQERGTGDKRQDTHVTRHFGKVVVGEEARLSEGAVPPEEIGGEQQGCPANRERSRAVEVVVDFGALGEVDEGPTRKN